MNISIIMAVYNSASFLDESIRSVLNQSYRDFELLLIDDGSTDQSWSICKKYEALDPRIRAFHQENQGISQVRNQGIAFSTGAWIRFMDADDTIPKESLERLLAPVQSGQPIDLVIGSFDSNDSAIYAGFDRNGLYSIEQLADHYLRYARSFYYGVTWNKLYRADIIKDHNIQFDPNLQWSEDMLFNLLYDRYCKHVYYTNKPVYYYNRRTDSLSKVVKDYNVSKVTGLEIKRFVAIHNFVSTIYPSNEKVNEIYNYLFSILNIILNNILNTSQYTYHKKYQEFKLVASNQNVYQYVKAYQYRNPYLLNRLMVWMIKRKYYRALYLFYDLKHTIRRNQKISAYLIKNETILPKFPL